MAYLVTALRQNPELAVFLTLALGFALGSVRMGSFKLGNVVGTLLAGVLIGQLDIQVSGTVKVVFFDLFLFATGYKVGPQFIRGMGRSALPQVAVTVVLCVTSLLVTLVAAKALGYDTGTAAGLLAGAFTESTVIGTASDAIARLGLPPATTDQLRNNIAVAYAVTYLVGTTGAVWFLSSLAPRLLRVDLAAEAQKLGEHAGNGARDGRMNSAYREWDVRSYRLAELWAGRRVSELEQSLDISPTIRMLSTFKLVAALNPPSAAIRSCYRRLTMSIFRFSRTSSLANHRDTSKFALTSSTCSIIRSMYRVQLIVWIRLVPRG